MTGHFEFIWLAIKKGEKVYSSCTFPCSVIRDVCLVFGKKYKKYGNTLLVFVCEA